MDKSKAFKVSKRVNKSTIVEHIPLGDHALKTSIKKKNKALKDEGRLLLKNKNAVLDYLGKHLSRRTRSRIKENVVHGFIEHGMINTTLKRVPVLQKFIASTKTIPTPEVYRLFHSSFHFIMSYSFNCGFQYIPNPVFMAVGFPVDDNKEGQPKIKRAGISKENEQRCAYLTGRSLIDCRAK